MSGPYKTPLPSVPEMIDELMAAGRTVDAACVELRNIIRDGAVTLVDFHDPPQTNEWLVSGAILVIDAFRTKTRSLPYLYPAYFAEGVVAARSQFEGAAGLSVTVKEIVPSNRRFVADEKLVAEALEGLQSNRWPNVHQAALALERRAEGASPQAKVRRLSDKIRKAMS